MATPVKNSLVKNTISSLNAIDDDELKLMQKFEPFMLYANDALPKGVQETVAWFITNAQAELRNNKSLMQAARQSHKHFFGALMKSIQLGLPIGDQFRQASMIPYNGEIKLQLWTRAYKTLVDRTKRYEEITILPVRESDLEKDEDGKPKFRVIFDDGKKTFKFEPNPFDEDSPKVGYIAFTRNLETGNLIFKTYSMKFIQKRRNAAKKKNVWDAWPDEMEVKTVLGAFCKNELSFEFETQKLIKDAEESEVKSYTLDVDDTNANLKEDVLIEEDVIEIEDVETISDFDKGLKQQWDNERKIKEEIYERVETAKAEEVETIPEEVDEEIKDMFK